MPDYSAEIIIRVVQPTSPGELTAIIRRVLRVLEARPGAKVMQGQQIKVVCTLPEQVMDRLPLDQTIDGAELLSVEAEPMGGPRH